MRLKGKVALITGGTSGIGRATARLFCKEGAKVAIVGRTKEKGEETLRQIKAEGGDILYICADVSNPVDVMNMVKKTVDEYGKIDILFNNAGISMNVPLEDMSLEVWNKIMDVNLKGVFLGTKYTIPIMKKQGKGSIVNTASTFSVVGGGKGTVAYCASKGGVLQFTKSAALELAPYNIRVNCICPGTTMGMKEGEVISYGKIIPREYMEARAKLHPLGKVGMYEEVAYAVLFLASEESSFSTGSALFVDGGYTAQ